LVAIEGQNFGSRIQNVEVRFNGVPARVITVTDTSIQAIVPYGATSGPITIVVFGQTLTGPDFTVKTAPPSSNLVRAVYSFVDASPASGGANLNFSNSDDAIALAVLPFDFSLFRETYLSGSRIAVTTNGWLSLEPVVSPEFQNSSLPASTVSRPGGSTGTVPPALIAPFWDDLIMQSGVGSVSIRTVGTAPNRRFVVQWSRMSILDEDGRDLNANLTFEAILYEGSNDIQFVYETLSGSRSDGSSATVGVQDLRRLKAHQSGFNQPILRSNHFISYRFREGDYSTLLPDTTPPTRPIVSDSGAVTNSRTELSASWTSEDPESGIREFQYAIGRTPGGTEVRPFTTTTQNSVVATGLNLEDGLTYYFAVRAVNHAGLVSELGFSDGIRVDPAFQPHTKIIPFASHGNAEFTGIAMFAPVETTVVLKAVGADGSLIAGTDIRNPATINLAAGQQFARTIPEIFGIQDLDGWVQLEASMPGLGVYTATGSWTLRELDGSVPRDLSADFVLFHAGADAMLVNPSTRNVNVTLTELASGTARSVTIGAGQRTTLRLSAVTRVRSSEPIAAVERFRFSDKLAFGAAIPVSSARSAIVFPHAVTGGGYSTTLTLLNVTGVAQEVAVSYRAVTRSFRLDGNAFIRLSLSEFLQIPDTAIQTGAVRVAGRSALFGVIDALVGVVDIESQAGLITLNPRNASTEAVFAHVAHGDGLFTGIAIATGDSAANVVIEVYPATGGSPKTAALTLEPNRQIAKLISELVPAVTTQMGGYIRIRSDQPIWAWELYGSADVIASAPPL
jgi:hypothetical protein